MEVVSGTSVLEETAAADLQDKSEPRSSFARHCTQFCSPCDLLGVEEKFTLKKSTSGIILIKESSRPPAVLVNDNSKVRLLANHTEKREQL